MSTAIASAPSPREPEKNYLNVDWSLKSWLLTLDHKRIAILYLVSVSGFFAVGGLFAMMIRLELLTPAADLLTTDTYNRMFTQHGVVMIFFFLIPSIPAVFGNFCLPLMLGTIDVAFPRLNLASWYLYMLGGLCGVCAILFGGVDTGWTFYTPLSSMYSNSNVILAAMGAFIAGFSSILTGLNFLVTIHRMRAPGMGWFRLPLFVWGMYATSIINILGTPVIAITLLLLMAERVAKLGIFDPALGGDPVLFQHLFWFYSHPAVYIMILPSMGVISELVAAFSRKRIFGYKFVAYSSIGIAVLGFLVWAHHMFTSGMSIYSATVFSVLTMLIAVPTAVKVINWITTMYRGSVAWETPMLYAVGFLGLFTIGGLTGLMLAMLGIDIAPPRHLLRGRALPLRDGRRRDHGLHGRAALLVAEDDRPHVRPGLVEAVGDPDLRRLQPDLLPAVPARLHGHAAPLRLVPRRVPGAQRDVFGRREHPGLRLPAAGALLRLVAVVRQEGRAQPLGRGGPRVAGAVAASGAQLGSQPVVTEVYDYTDETILRELRQRAAIAREVPIG